MGGLWHPKHNRRSGASKALVKQPLLFLATFLLAFNQLQPLLLDVFPGEDKAIVFVSKIKGVWRRQWRGMGWRGSAGAPVLCLHPWEELAGFGGLVASWRALMPSPQAQALSH